MMDRNTKSIQHVRVLLKAGVLRQTVSIIPVDLAHTIIEFDGGRTYPLEIISSKLIEVWRFDADTDEIFGFTVREMKGPFTFVNATTITAVNKPKNWWQQLLATTAQKPTDTRSL